MSTTLAQIRTEFLNIVNQPSNSTVYTTTFINTLANSTQDEICREFKFPFLKSKSLFNTGLNTTAGAAIDTTDLTITVGATTGFASAGSVWIEGDIINYTGKTSTTLTGCTNIDIDHDSGVEVEPLYAMPSDFNHNAKLFITNNTQNRRYEYDYVLPEDYDFTRDSLRWTIVSDKDSSEYIRIKNLTSSEIAEFSYYKKPTIMTDSVNATIPDDFALEVLPRIMAGVAMIIRDDDVQNLGSTIRQVGREDIMAMKRYYSTRINAQTTGLRSRYKSRPNYNTRYRLRQRY